MGRRGLIPPERALFSLHLLLFPALIPLCGNSKNSWNPEYREGNGQRGGRALFGAVAKVIEKGDDIPRGPSAKGEEGDYILFNRRVQFVIQGLHRDFGFALSGGNIIDAATKKSGKDLLAQNFTFLDNTFPRQFIYEKIGIISKGGSEAVIEVEGYDSDRKEIKGRTRYILYPDLPYLTIMTEVINMGSEKIEEYEFGDAIEWGGVTFFVPHYGTELAGRITPMEWMIGGEEDVYYGWTAAGTGHYGPHGASWSDFIVDRVDLLPGERRTFERYLVVAESPEEVLDALVRLKGVEVGLLKGEAGTPYGEGVEGGKALIFDREGRLYTMVSVKGDSTFSSPLPEGRYTLAMRSRLRRMTDGSKPFDIVKGEETRLLVPMSGRGRLKAKLRDERGYETPVKLTFSGIRGTPDPDLGPRYKSDGALNTVLSMNGEFDLSIPPGDYIMTASKGIEYDLFERVISVREGPGEVVTVEGTIERAFDTEGYLSADFHQHSSCSIDSLTPLKDILVANMAEGVEIVGLTNHDLLCRDEVESPLLEESKGVRIFFGQEITAPSGHFNIFPLPLSPDYERGGFFRRGAASPLHLTTILREIRPEVIIQVNHPRAAVDGYFNIMDYDPKTGKGATGMSEDFDLIEIANGKRMKDTEKVLKDWFSLLNRGLPLWGVGNSDSHHITTQERGYPRTFLKIPGEPCHVTGEDLLAAFREGVVSVTNGPFPLLEVNDTGIGGLVSTDSDAVRIRIEVFSAAWVSVDSVELIRNGVLEKRFRVPEGRKMGGVRFRKTFSSRVRADSWFVVLVKGEKGLGPVLPPYKGTVIKPMAITNPVWVDRNNNGRFDPPF